jgi:hypothetical protein
MLKINLKNLFWTAAALFCTTQFCCAQAVGPAVENTSTASTALINLGPNLDNSLTMAGEYKQPKNVIEQEKPVCWNWYADVGYWSQYNFRGTNLTPDSDGAIFLNADVSKWGFTLGFFFTYQLGTASAPAFSISEGGGGGGVAPVSPNGFVNSGPVFPETIQKRFNEFDVFLQYSRDIGPINVTVGNIGFFINRDAKTTLFLPDTVFGPIANGTYGPYDTVGNEQFDRLFIRLSTSKIPYIEPWITYYQTIYSEGHDTFHHDAPKQGFNPFGFHTFFNSFERSPEDYGGYLEGRLRGHFPITQWLDFNPFGVISYSFGDRSEPVTNPANFSEFIRGRPLRDWNVAQAGLEVPIHLFHVVGHSSGPCAPPDFRLNLVPFMTYSYHISDPPPGTDRNEWWGGAKVAITF